MQKLVFTNANGESVDFTDFENYCVTSWEGFANVSQEVQSQTVPFHDGSVYIDTLLNDRELSITVAMNDRGNLQRRYELKENLISILNPKMGIGKLVYTNDYLSRQISVVTAIPVFPTKNINDNGTLKFSVSFTANNPYWEDLEEKQILIQPYKETALNVDGDLDVSPSKIHFIYDSNANRNFKIRNITNGSEFSAMTTNSNGSKPAFSHDIRDRNERLLEAREQFAGRAKLALPFGQAVVNGVDAHGLGHLGRDGAVFIQQVLRDPQDTGLHPIGVADDAAVEHLGGTGQVGHELGDEAAGAGLGGAQGQALLPQEVKADLLGGVHIHAEDVVPQNGLHLRLHGSNEGEGFLLGLGMGGDPQFRAGGLGIGGQGGVGHGVHLLPKLGLHSGLADAEQLQRVRGDHALGQGLQIGYGPVAEHGGAFAGRAGEHDDMGAVGFKGTAGCGAPVVFQNGAVFPCKGISPIIGTDNRDKSRRLRTVVMRLSRMNIYAQGMSNASTNATNNILTFPGDVGRNSPMGGVMMRVLSAVKALVNSFSSRF